MSVTRRVAVEPVGFSTTLLAETPSWPSAEIATTPRLTTTSPVKSLPTLRSSRVPSPVLVRPETPLILPSRMRPEVKTERVALATW